MNRAVQHRIALGAARESGYANPSPKRQRGVLRHPDGARMVGRVRYPKDVRRIMYIPRAQPVACAQGSDCVGSVPKRIIGAGLIPRRSITVLVIAFTLSTFFAQPSFAQSGGGYNLRWSTIDNGGGTSTSTGDGFRLRGTIGQPDAGILMVDGYVLRGGYWVPRTPMPPKTAPYPHNRRKNRYISFDPDKDNSDGEDIAFRVELLSINQGSCDDGTGAQGGNVDFCRFDRGAADCKACSTSGDSCISASIDCPPGETCDPTGADCVNDLPNSGGSNVGLAWWVGPEKNTATDPDLNIHLLVSEPFRKVSDNWPNPVHAGDCEVVPQASYGVRAVETAGGAESDELVVETTQFTPPPTGNAPFWWGDVVGVLAFHCNADIQEQTCDPNTANGDCTGSGVPAACCTGVGTGLCDCPGGDPCERAWELPNGVTNVDDVTAALWASAPAPPTTVSADFTWVDVHGNDSFTPGSQNFDPPNNKINASDLQQIISGFGGFPYKFYDPADCPDESDWP